ncbi:MAG: hypothetical protein DWQ20_00805 [Actinobacteria bacterium]|nr:MAG: hypothetical protein DWQ20_00805 [Actinomycetota bacterium]
MPSGPSEIACALLEALVEAFCQEEAEEEDQEWLLGSVLSAFATFFDSLSSAPANASTLCTKLGQFRDSYPNGAPQHLEDSIAAVETALGC